MIQNLFFIFLFLVSNLALSEEVKLSCDMKVTKLYSTGSEEHLNINEVFDIIDSGSIKSITPLSPNFNGTTTRNFEGKLSYKDYSTPNKWHLNEAASSGDAIVNTTIIIDRHSGKISYSGLFKNPSGSVTTSAVGDCVKLDTTKKKF
ncbi:MAG: hypothetical protein EB109_03695 [Methylophilaceae bacterium]|nr:hypothetical protein [Methylophilaceae bacterium]